MGYYSYGLGQVLQQAGGINLSTSTRTSGSPTGGGTVLDIAARQRIAAMMEQRASGLPPAPTTFNLLTPRKPAGRHTTIQMDPAAAAAMGPSAGVGSKVGAGGPGGAPAGGGSMPTTEAQFAMVCKAEGGSLAGPMKCQLGDGAIVTVDAQGNAVCVNAAGRCATAGKAGGALMLGAAALAAMMLLR